MITLDIYDYLYIRYLWLPQLLWLAQSLWKIKPTRELSGYSQGESVIVKYVVVNPACYGENPVPLEGVMTLRGTICQMSRALHLPM